MSEPPPKVFCSHRSVDKSAVEEFARRLRERGIDAWLDTWEIVAGADVVAKINAGLAEAQAVLVFFSNATVTGAWVGAEISAAIERMIEDGLRVIPVLIDDDAPIPPLLRPRARRGIDEFEAIVDGILGRTSKPPLGPVPVPERVERLAVTLQVEADGLTVSAVRDGRVVASVASVRLPADLPQSYADFLQGRMKIVPRSPAEATRQSLERSLVALGESLGAVLFPGPVGAEVARLVDSVAPGVTAELAFEAPPHLLPLPFEAARLADGRLPALAPGVAVLRRLRHDGSQAASPPSPYPALLLPGPLKILVAVGAPDEGQTPNQVLDLEGELQGILDALDVANRRGNAQVRILEVGHPEQIGNALKEDAFHVLHLSGHGMPGAIELETEDGAAYRASAKELADRLKETGKPLPLVFLSSCHGGVAASETASFAQGLLAAGVPLVVSMQGRVSDRYAARLAGEFYGELGRGGDRPRASLALARARRELEKDRREALGRGESALEHEPEYAAASLFCRGEELPLLDLSLDLDPLRVPPVHRVEGPVPQLSVGELIGRRKELREVLRVLRDDPKAVKKLGKRAGVVLTGIGGVGKSCLAGRAMARLKEAGWAVAAVRDRFELGEICRAVAAAIQNAGWVDLAPKAAALTEAEQVDVQKLDVLLELLRTRDLALVLDNFETNLTVGGAEVLDPLVRDSLRALCDAAQEGKLLLTCRYPLPGLAAYLHEVPVGPLSTAQSRKLLLRLPGIQEREPAELAGLLRRIGGHPRMLEYVDALVRGGAARLPQVRVLLDKFAADAGVRLGDGAGDLDRATREAILVGAQDVLLRELLALADAAGDGETLRQAAVSSLPLTPAGLAHSFHDRPAGAEEVQVVKEATERLGALSLLTRHETGEVSVHRWTAESLRDSADPVEHCERCRRAGSYRAWRVENESPALEDAMEAVENFLEAEAFDEASAMALAVAGALQRFRQLAGVATFAGEVLRRLPEDHPNFAALADQEGQALLALGYSDEAFLRYEQLLAAHRARAEAKPDRADLQYNMSVSFEKVGDLQMARGRGEAAGQSYERSLAAIELLASSAPKRADYQRQLSVVYEKVGNLQRAQGQGESARQSYERSLAIMERLASSEPERADYQRDLSVSYDRVGDLQSAQGQGESARQSYERSLAIRERLASSEPDRADYQRDLAVSFDKLSRLAEQLGVIDDALAFRWRCLQAVEALAAAEPGRADHARDLAISLLETARLDPPQAPGLVRRVLDLLEPLAAQNRLDAQGLSLLEDAHALAADLGGA